VKPPPSPWNGAAAWMENLALGVFARNTLKKQEDKNKTLGNSRHLPCFCESGEVAFIPLVSGICPQAN
jgi:hypothetical protein